MAVCTRCSGTRIAIRRETRKTEVLVDARTGHAIPNWELARLSVEETKRRVAAGEYQAKEQTVTTEVAHLGHYCPECEEGRRLEELRKSREAASRKDRRMEGD